VIAAIEAIFVRVYSTPMRSAVLRLLALVTVLLMPLGMEPASAADHQISMAGMAMQHCPGPSSKHQHNDGLATCSMACASALPAQEQVRDEPPVRRPQPVIPMAGRVLRGIHPEIATPPPKLA
jgi:hypothetical protein